MRELTRKLNYAIITFSLLSIYGPAGALASIGPFGGNIACIAIDPNVPSTMYACAGGVFKSTNAGAQWFPVTIGALSLVIDPTNSDTIYAAGVGVSKSTDGGGSWTPLSLRIPIGLLAIDPEETHTLYAVCHEAEWSFAWGLYKTTNGGATWLRIAFSNRYIGSLIVDPSHSNIIYLSHFRQGEGSVLKSTDGGESWLEASAGLPDRGVAVLALDPGNPNTIYGGVDWRTGDMHNLYVSTKGGESWSPLAQVGNGSVSTLAVDPNDSNTIYAALAFGQVYKSTTRGQIWTSINNGLSHRSVRALALDPENSQEIYAGTEGGVYQSLNGGGRWSARSIGIDRLNVKAIAIDPEDSNTIYVGTGSGLHKTRDGGESWSEMTTGLDRGGIDALAIDQKTVNTLYAGSSSDGGIYKSTNGGAHWLRVSTLGANALAIDPMNSDTVYAGVRGFDTGGVFKTTDGGNTWFQVDSGFLERDVRGLALDPRASDTIYAGTFKGGLYKSRNGGKNWSQVSSIFYVVSIVIDPKDPMTVYAGALSLGDEGGVYKSTDGGGRWAPMNRGLGRRPSVASLALDPKDSTTIYAGLDDFGSSNTEKGVYQTHDGGENWLATGLTGRNISVVTVDPYDQNIVYAGVYAGIDGNSLAASYDGGQIWY